MLVVDSLDSPDCLETSRELVENRLTVAGAVTPGKRLRGMRTKAWRISGNGHGNRCVTILAERLGFPR